MSLESLPKNWVPMEPPASWPEIVDYPDAVFRRRSRRNFIKKPMGREGLNALLHSVCGNEGSPYDQSVAVGFLVGQAEDMEPGFYLLDGKKEAWYLVSSGAVHGQKHFRSAWIRRGWRMRGSTSCSWQTWRCSKKHGVREGIAMPC